MHTVFEGIWLPIITPMQADGLIDHVALARLTCHLAGQGIHGLVAGATTGEGVLLQPGEQEAVFATLREAAPELPIILGVTQFATDAAVAQARQLARLKPDGLLVTPPSYVRPTQAGIQRHYEAVVEASDLPLVVYNIPFRTGVNVEVDTLQALARDPRVVAIKECGGNNERTVRLVQETPLKVLSGDDAQNFPVMCLGGHGAIAGSAHIHTRWHVRLYQLVKQGKLDEARRLHTALLPLMQALFAEPNPIPVKALLAEQGWCQDILRLPFLPASQGLRERLRALSATLEAFTS
ncbi:4-hydroxy-tetrahydrodipicolinate synthase [Leeia sp.]|uniref:4-hydroxy-tetrahydrodipicolinate synthase n=1 Tax=Leeia sp. TaxID=2884678 RepID=UPI0035ADB949